MSPSIRSLVFGLGFATLGATAVIGTQVLAQQGPGPGQGLHQRGMGPEAMGPGAMGAGMGQLQALIADLDLSDDQRAQAQELRAELREIASAHREEKQADREIIVTALEAEPVDAEAIHALIDARQARQLEMSHAVADAALDFFTILTSEQQAVVLDRADRLQERRGRMREALQAPAQ